MGRLDHLKQTLPLRIRDGVENIVVDWSCPQNTADWVMANYPSVKVIRVDNQKFYHRTKPRNIALSHATGDFVCNADADLICNDQLFDLVIPKLDKKYMYVRIPTLCKMEAPAVPNGMVYDKACWTNNKSGDTEYEVVSLYGFMIYPKDMVLSLTIPGYNELFVYHAGEDGELRYRLLYETDIKEAIVPPECVDSIQHSDYERTQFLSTSDYRNVLNQSGTLMVNIAGKYILNPATLLKKTQSLIMY